MRYPQLLRSACSRALPMDDKSLLGFSGAENTCVQTSERPHQQHISLRIVSLLLVVVVMPVMVTRETPLGMTNTGADDCVPGIQFVSWYRMGHQLHTHRFCSSLFTVLLAWLGFLKSVSPVYCLTSIENTLSMDQKAWIPCFLHLLLLE